MSISTVVTRGYGAFGSVNKLPTWGYGIGAAAQPTYARIGTLIGASRQIGTLAGMTQKTGVLSGSSQQVGTIEGTG